MMCFQCVDGFIYSILCTSVTMYYVLQHSQGPTLNCQWRVIWNEGLSWRCCPRCLTLTVRLHMLWLRTEPFPFIAALALRRGCFSAIWHCCFTFQWSRGTFVWLPLSKTMLSQRQVFGISVTSATSTVILLSMCCPLLSPPRISTDTQPSLCRHELSARSHKDWERTHLILPSTLTPNHVLLNYSNGANPMHFSLCNMYSCLWCSSAICRKNPVIAIQY